MSIKEQTGLCLRQIRVRRGLTMKQVQEAGGPTKAFQSDVERGKRGITVEMLFRWCDALGCDPMSVVLTIQEKGF